MFEARLNSSVNCESRDNNLALKIQLFYPPSGVNPWTALLTRIGPFDMYGDSPYNCLGTGGML